MARTPMVLETHALHTEPEDEGRTRKRVNTILPQRIYQRGQILTWTRADKAQMLVEHGIRLVVNFWPKLDADLTDMELDWYLYVPVERSINMTAPHVLGAAGAVAAWVTQGRGAALVLCEAGKTRSVFFSALVLAQVAQVSLAEAYHRVVAAAPHHSLKKFMIEYLLQG